jgi:Tfp pilus assembly protein PilO
MVLSKRERIMLIGTLACIGLFIVNRFVVEPVQAKLDELEAHRQQLLGDLNEAELLIGNHRRMQEKWKAMLSDGLRSDTEAESRVLGALREWSGAAGLALSSIKPERVSSDGGLQEMIFTVAGKGTLDSVARFLWQIETAALPVKIKDMQLGSSSESGDSMSLQLHLSALYLGTQQRQLDNKQPEVKDEEGL